MVFAQALFLSDFIFTLVPRCYFIFGAIEAPRPDFWTPAPPKYRENGINRGFSLPLPSQNIYFAKVTQKFSPWRRRIFLNQAVKSPRPPD